VPELLGQTLLEVMSFGTLAVCTKVAWMPEVAVDEETGFVVPPNDPAALREKLEWLPDRPNDLTRLGLAGRQRVLQTFPCPAVIKYCPNTYEYRSLIGNHMR